MLLTVGRSYVGNDVTPSTLLDRACACYYENLPKYRSYRVSNTAPWFPILWSGDAPRFFRHHTKQWVLSRARKMCAHKRTRVDRLQWLPTECDELDRVYNGNCGLDQLCGFIVLKPFRVQSADVSFLRLLRLTRLELKLELLINNVRLHVWGCDYWLQWVFTVYVWNTRGRASYDNHVS